MKVYILTAWSYSDYHIVGVFSTMEAAEACMSEKLDHNDPEEYELDELVGHVAGPTWDVHVANPSGSIRIYLGDCELTDLRHPTACVTRENRQGWTVTSPISEEHAIKVATELRQQLLREGKLPPESKEPTT